jgi:formylglycine-generating enzyme required for sulfatase activity
LNHRILVPGHEGETAFAPEEFPLALSVGGAHGLLVERAGSAAGVGPRLNWANGGVLLEPVAGSGVSLNGKPLMAPARLEHGDVLELAGKKLVFSRDGMTLRLSPGQLPGQTATGTTGDEPSEFIKPVPFQPGLASRKTWRDVIRPFPVAVAAIFLALGSVAWFLLSARSVEIRSEPPGAQVEISSGGFSVELGGRYLMRTGSYRVRLQLDGYHVLDQELQVSELQNQSYQMRLEKLPGLLQISSIPASGTEVLVDGKHVGITPLEALSVQAGPRTIRIEAPRYFPYELQMDVQGMGIEQSIMAELSPRWAEVSLASQPAGAEILVDGEPVGRTPLTVEILDGTHELQLSLEGYKSWIDRIEVTPGQAMALPPVQMVRADGLVKIRTNPAGASITVDGQFRGQSPLDLALPPGRSYQLRASKAGYKSTSQNLTVSSGKDIDVSLSLQPFLGEVRIRSNPGDATVYVDGKESGRTGENFELSAVPHRIEIRKPGFSTYTVTITPRPGFAQEVRAELKTVEQARIAALPRIVTSSAGHELRLVQPGRFSMGTSRREQGRRSNESLRQAEITRRYYIATREVTNDQFRQFSKQHNAGSYKGLDLNRDDYPASGVSWDQAVEYCNWLSAQDGLPAAYTRTGDGWRLAEPYNKGYRLPTEAEWAWAARYQGGIGELKFPWGGSMPPVAGAGNFADISAKQILGLVLQEYNDGYAAAAPVGKFSANAMGLSDLGGNVAEWVHDYYQTYPGAVSELFTDPMGPVSGEMHVIRGSSWRHATLSELRIAYRDFDKQARPDVGFRLARFAE